MLQIMPIFLPVGSGGGGDWTIHETKIVLAFYITFAVLWILYSLYHMIFKRMSFMDSQSLYEIGIIPMIINIFFHALTFCGIIGVIGYYIYKLLS